MPGPAERQGRLVWSVCTGALALGSAGLLEGRRATTHHAFFEQLKTYGARVEMARAASDGNVTTGGGTSSSIDVGLELVRQTLSEKLARNVRERMEYPPPQLG